MYRDRVIGQLALTINLWYSHVNIVSLHDTAQILVSGEYPMKPMVVYVCYNHLCVTREGSYDTMNCRSKTRHQRCLHFSRKERLISRPYLVGRHPRESRERGTEVSNVAHLGHSQFVLKNKHTAISQWSSGLKSKYVNTHTNDKIQ